MTTVEEVLFSIQQQFSPSKRIVRVDLADALNMFLAEDLLLPEKQNIYNHTNFATYETTLKRGTLLRAYELGILHKLDIEQLNVYKAIEVCIQPVYTQLYPIKPIISPIIKSLIKDFNGVNTIMEPMLIMENPDVDLQIKTLIDRSDIIMLTGYDHHQLAPKFEQFGIKFLVNRISQTPGEKTLIGFDEHKVVFFLPEEQTGALLSAEIYGRAAVLKALGKPFQLIKATSASNYENKTAHTHFSIGRFSVFDKEVIVNFQQKVDEIILTDYANANCYVRIHPHSNVVKGSQVEIVPFIGN
ncbi:hypothetical protein NF867_11395 [Solitalea sp. MAHUQ-68]|uniref:Uncharacterized protein n=1 Tax=Solitalea agri TaxID=2953739 RepID=A0A9X2JE13_9SPHI|nr:hypothetical protein [Solitalea agri]MCO4293470.1 hypothetical protein [Solitalea agri]